MYVKFRFDEFGFRVEEEDGPEQSSKKLLGIPFVEDPQHRSVNHTFFFILDVECNKFVSAYIYNIYDKQNKNIF